MNFESELKKGNFMVTECNNCQKIVWPPSIFCNKCFKKTQWRKSTGEGKIIEFSKKDDQFFCIAEIENSIKIIGQIDYGIPAVGDKIRILECGMVDENMHVKLEILR